MSHRAGRAPFVILGGGVAGAAAAAAVREAGHAGRVVLVGAERELPYHRPPLTKAYLRGEVDAESLAVRPSAWYREHSIDVVLGATATAIHPDARVVVVRGHGPVAYDRLVVATGPPVRSNRLPGSIAIRTIADADALRAAARPGRSVLVAGGGVTGGEVATTLAGMDLRVTIAEAGDALVSELDEATRERLVERARAMGIDVQLRTVVTASTSEVGRRLVRTGDRILETDILVDARGSVHPQGDSVLPRVEPHAVGQLSMPRPGDRIAVAGAAALAGDDAPGGPSSDQWAALSGAAAAMRLLGHGAASPPATPRMAALFGERVVIGAPPPGSHIHNAEW